MYLSAVSVRSSWLNVSVAIVKEYGFDWVVFDVAGAYVWAAGLAPRS